MFNISTITRLKLILFWRTIRWPCISFLSLGLIIFLSIYLYNNVKKGMLINGKIHEHEEILNTSADKIQMAIITGKYDTAIEQLVYELKLNPNDVYLKKLYSQLIEELKVDFKFNYLPGRLRHITTRGPTSEIVLTEKDPYYVIVHSSTPCFLYLFQLQSSGDLTILFPNSKYVPTPNPVLGGPVRIPDGYEWFYLDNVPGIETIYLVASRWRQKELETLSTQLASEHNIKEKSEEIIKQILIRLHNEEQQTDNLPGLVFAKHQFKHEVSSQ